MILIVNAIPIVIVIDHRHSDTRTDSDSHTHTDTHSQSESQCFQLLFKNYCFQNSKNYYCWHY